MKNQLKKIDLLLKEIQDPHAQENFWRLKNFLEALQLGGTTTIVVPPTSGGSGSSGGATTTQVVDTFDCVSSLLPGNFVYVDGTNSVAKVTNNTTAQIPKGIFGVVLTKPTAVTANVCFVGRVAGYSGLTVGGAVFVSTTGTATPNPPALGMVQQIGIATSTSEIFVNLKQAFRRA